MASDNLMTAEQMWPIRSAFSDAWISDIFTRENDVLTKALQMPVAVDSTAADAFLPEIAEPLFWKPDITPIQTPTASGGSEKEFVSVSKQRRGTPGPSGRVAKRKSARTSKRTNTTFVAVDPENFRQMVQQVTGVKFSGFDGGELPLVTPVLKPEAHRAVWGVHHGSVLDTSSFFLDGFASSSAAQIPSPPVAAGGEGSATPAAIDFDPFSFPTLESWKVIS